MRIKNVWVLMTLAMMSSPAHAIDFEGVSDIATSAGKSLMSTVLSPFISSQGTLASLTAGREGEDESEQKQALFEMARHDAIRYMAGDVEMSVILDQAINVLAEAAHQYEVKELQDVDDAVFIRVIADSEL